MRLVLGREDVSGASGMAEQFADGHAGSKVPVGVVGPVGCDRLIERELSLPTSCRIAIEVNILFMDPRQNWVSVVFSICVCVSAIPQVDREQLAADAR